MSTPTPPPPAPKTRLHHDARVKVGILHYQLMAVTVLAESPPLGPLIDGTGLFSLGLGNAVEVGMVVVKSMKFRHALAFGTFVIGSVRQHEAIAHLASLRAPPVDGQVGTVRRDSVRYGTARYGTVWNDTVRHGTVWYSTVRYSTVRCGTVRVRYGTEPYGLGKEA